MTWTTLLDNDFGLLLPLMELEEAATGGVP